MDSIKQDDRKFGVEDRIQSILLGYLNTFDKEGVAAVHIPPQFTKKTDVEEEGKEKGEEKPGTPPQENEVSKEGSGVPTKEIGSENAVDSIALEKPLDELEMKKEKIEGEGADKVIKMEDDDDEIKEEVPFTITSGSTPGEAGSEEKKAPEEAQNEEAILEKIIEYYNTDKNKLGVVLKNTTIATHELHNAFQDFIISVDTIKDSEIQNFKASKGPAIVNNITSVALSLLEPNKAQVGVSFVFFMFKLMLQDIIDFLGVDEMSLPLFSQTFEFKTEHFNPDGRLVTLLGLTLLGLSELGATRENEGTQNNFYREVCHLLVNHFSRESKRNVEGLNTRNVCEELIYYGIAFNFYDYQSFTITRMEDEENKKTTTSNPMEEFFDTLAISINANKSEIPPSKIVEVFKRLTYGMVAETAAAIPRGVHTTLISLSPTDPEYYFAVNELFRFLFTPERDDEILLSTDGVPNGYLEAWVLVLGTLTLKDKDFKGNLISAVLMALTSPKVPFGEFLEKLATTNLKVLEAYKEDVNRVLENVWAIVRETLKEKLKGVKPEYLIALPKSIFEGKDFQNEIEDISLDHKESYFRIHHDNLNDPHTLVETIDRLLGNNKKCNSPSDALKIIVPLENWFTKKRSFDKIVDFIYTCVERKDYSSRFDCSLSDVFRKVPCNYRLDISDFISMYSEIKQREENIKANANPGSVALYELLMQKLADSVAFKLLKDSKSAEVAINSLAEVVSNSDRASSGEKKEPFIPVLYTVFIELAAQFAEKKALETKWLSLSQTNFSGLIFFENSHKERGSWGASVSNIRAKLAEEADLIRSERIKYTVAQLLYERRGSVEELFSMWGITGITAANLATLFVTFKEVKVAADRIIKVALWIKSSGFEIEAKLFTEETTLEEMRTTGARVTAEMKAGDVRLDELEYFVVNDSQMFMRKLKDLSGEAIEMKKIGKELKFVNIMLNDTYAFFKWFFAFEQITFGDYEKIDELVRRHERDFDREIQVISKSKGIDTTGTLNKKVALEYLLQGMMLRTLAEGCRSMVAFMHSMNIGDKRELQDLEKVLSKFYDDMPIVKGGELLQEIRQYVGDISDFQVGAFNTIHKCTDVTTFIMSIWKDFDIQTQFVTGQHGSDFETALINALRHVKMMLSFVERGISTRKPVSIASFCDDAKKMLPTTMNEMERFTSNLTSIYDHLTMIRVWYMSITSTSVDADNLIPFLSDVLSRGEFWGKLPRQGEAALCLVKRRNDKVVSEYGPKFIQEFVRGLKIFLGKKRMDRNDAKANTDTLLAEGFVELTESAGEAFRVVEELRDKGHPKYQVESVSIGGPLSQEIERAKDETNSEWELRVIKGGLEKMRMLQTKYHNDEAIWRETMKRTIEVEKRLVFLDNAQLLRFWHNIVEHSIAMNDPRLSVEKTDKSIERAFMHNIYPYLWICFPDSYGIICSRTNGQTLRKKVEEIFGRIPPNTNPDDTNPEFAIDIIKSVLSEAGNMAEKFKKTSHTFRSSHENNSRMEDEEEDEGPEGEASARILKYVLEKPWNTPNDVYACVSHKIFKGRVHPSYIFKCNAHTSSERLKNFLKRVKLFPKFHFVLENVNELSTRVKESLLRWVNERFEAGTMSGHLHMIFTEEYGTELFNFVKTEEPEGEPGAIDCWGQPVNLLDRSGGSRDKELWPNIENVKIYDGEPLSGKTELALEDVAKHLKYHQDRKTSISVTEDFTLSDVSRYIQRDLFVNETLFPDVAIYLNVSPYAPLEEFGIFMYNMLAWGIIADQRTGEVLYLYTKLKLNIFIEIGTAPEGDPECSFTDSKAVLSMIPLIHSVKPVFSHEKIRYKFSEDAKVCATVMNAINYPIVDYGHFYTKANPNSTFVSRADHKDFIAFTDKLSKDSPSLAIQGRIVKILSERYKSLVRYAELIKSKQAKPFRKYPSFRELIVKAFEEEISQYTRYPLGNIERFTYFPPDGSEPAVMDFSEGSQSEQPREDRQVRCLRFVSLEQVCQSLEELYTLIGGAFGVSVNSCRTLLEGRGYVLTPDFAMKLMYLNTCRNSNQNVVFSGDTGTGKSELLEVFSQLINLGSPVIPRPLELLREAFKDLIKDRNAGRYDLVGAIEDLCDSPATFPEACNRVAALTNDYLERYKLVYPTAEMRQAKEAFETNRVAECLVRKEHVLQVVQDILRGRLRDIFHRIQMHQHIYPPEFRERINSVAKSAELVKDSKVTIIGFIDECTSTSIMGMIKEVLIDNMLDGKKLPENIMWIGAFNRNREASGFTLSSSVSAMSLSSSFSSSSLSSSSSDSDENLEEMEKGAKDRHGKKEILDFTGIDDNKEKHDFAVRPPPTSFEMLEIQFSPMSGKQQRYFLRNLLKLRTDLSIRADHDCGEFDEIDRAISFAHEFLREKNIPRVHPSIRDLVRCINLYAYFRRHHAEHGASWSYFPEDLSTSTTGTRVHTYSLVLAIAISYYFRVLPEYRAEFSRRYVESGLPSVVKNAAECGGDVILATFKSAALLLYENTAFREGIAATDSFLENLFCTVVCIDAKVPLMVVGPPGCSKTLSFSIAMKNMRGRHSVSDFYKTLSCVHPLRYQCSTESVDTEIQAVYDNAITRQNGFDTAAEEGKTSNIEHQRVVVLLDEAGLPDEDKAPLKILHYVLDHPQVSTVILSNTVLDAAKTNRTALLIQMAPENDDLHRLVQTCVYGDSSEAATTAGTTPTGTVLRSDQMAVVRALARGYKEILTRQGKEYDGERIVPVNEFFHLRDFVYLLRYLGRIEAKHGDITSPQTLIVALRRNFGGVNEKCFCSIVKIFLCAMAHEVPEYRVPTDAELEELLNRNTIVEALRESLSEKIERLDDPNTAPYRYILLIDPSDSELGVSLLFDMELCERDKTDIVHIPDFTFSEGSGSENDRTGGHGVWRRIKTKDERAKEDAIIRMKDAMEDEDGKTVVLVNAMEISTSFYDVFNRHFDVLNTVGKDGTTHYKYFANVAVGSLSQPCPVNPDFRAIVHLPMSAIRRTPAPFLNRFEKYYMSLETIYNGHANKMRSADPSLYNAVEGLKAGANDMVTHFHGKSFFYGIVPEETVTSLMLPITEALVDEDISGSKVSLDATARISAHIPPIFHPNKTKPTTTAAAAAAKGAEATGETVSEQLEQVRRLNYRLFQLARPECVFSRLDIPDWYKREYLVSQEHFSIRRLIRGVFRAADGKFSDSESSRADFRKWCIFTRTCGELSRIHEQKKVRDLLLNWEGKGAPDTWADVLALEAVSTSEECNARIDKFLSTPEKNVFVCTANIAKVSSDQINLVRSRINSDFGCEDEGSKRIVFVILHFPPEIQHLQNVSSSQAVFFNKWNFSYVDTLGVYANVEREGTIEGEELGEPNDSDEAKEEDVEMDDAGECSLDARNWLGYAYGIKEINEEKVLALFKKEITKEGKTLIGRTAAGGAKIPKSLLPNSKDSYGNFRAKFKQLFGTLVEKQGAAVFTSFFRYIVDVWFRLVKDIVKNDCNAVMSGARSSGLLCHLDTSLKRIYVPAAKGLIEMICSNYTLEAILYAFKKGRKDAAQGCPDKEVALMRAVIEALPPFSVDDIMRSPSSSSSMSFSQRGVVYERTKSTPAYLPFFNVIFKRVGELAKAAKILAQKNSYEAAAITLERLIDESNIRGIADMIFSDSYLSTLYKRDFVVWGLGLPDLYTPHEELCSNPRRAVWLDKCVQCIDSLTRGHANKLAYIHFVPDFFQREVYRVSSAIAPLLKLDPIPSSLELMDKITSFDNPDKLTRAIVLSDIRILYKFLMHSGDDEAGNDARSPSEKGRALKLFAQTFKEIRSFAPRKSAVKFLIGPQSDLALLNLETIIYYFVLNMTQYSSAKESESYDAENERIFEMLAPIVMKNAAEFDLNNVAMYEGISFAVKLLNEYRPEEETGRMFISNIVLYYLEYDAGEREPMPDDIFADVEVLINSCNNILPKSWILQFLGRWLEAKPIEWSTRVLNVFKSHVPKFGALDLMEPNYKNMDRMSFLHYHLLMPYVKRQLAAMKYEGDGNFKIELLRKKFKFLSTNTQSIIDLAVKASLLLTLFASEVVSTVTNDDAACEILGKLDIAGVLSSIFRNNRVLVNADVYFFSSFQDETFVQNICRWGKFIRAIGLEYYYIQISEDAEGLFVPPYVINSEEPLFKPYHALEVAVNKTNITNDPRELVTRASSIGTNSLMKRSVKMMLVIIFYYNFFVKNIAMSPAISRALSTLTDTLDIQPEEKVALEFFTRGQLNIDDPRIDPLLSEFSVKGRQDSDNMYSHLMANVLSFTLGCRRYSTHMYERAFDLPALNNNYGPGSAYKRYNWDCGYRIAADGKFEWGVTPPIMHENRAYRLALNSITWSAICWSQITNPSKNFRAAMSNTHFINCLDDERKRFGLHTRTDMEAVHAYLFARGTTFFYEFSTNQDYIDKNINMLHFINESLMELWRLDSSPSPPGALIGHHTTETQAYQYENIFEGIFNKVNEQYPLLKRKLLDSILKSNEKLKRIFDIKAKCGLNLKSPFVGMQFFEDYVSKDAETDPACGLIKQFLLNRNKFAVLRKVPIVVEFYLELYKALDFRITDDDLNTMTIGDVLKLPGTDRLQALWPAFEAAWKEVREGVKSEECAAAQAFEQEVAVISTEMPFIGRILTIPDLDEESGGGELFRIIENGLAPLQDKILTKRDVMGGENEGMWNQYELGFKTPIKSGEALALESLTDNELGFSKLITGETYRDELSIIVGCNMTTDDVLSRNSIRFDTDAIARHIMYRYTGGRMPINPQGYLKEHFKRPCHLLSVDVEAGAASVTSDTKGRELLRTALIESFNPLHGINSLRIFVHKYNQLCSSSNDSAKQVLDAFNVGLDGGMLGTVDRNILRIFGARNQEEVSEEQIEEWFASIAGVLAAVLRYVVVNVSAGRDMSGVARQSIADVYKLKVSGDEVPGHLDFILRPSGRGVWNASHLVPIANELLDIVETKRYMFEDVAPHFKVNFPEPLARTMENLRKRVLGTKDIGQREATAEVIDILFQVLGSRSVLVESRILRALYDKRLRSTFNDVELAIAESLLPVTLKSTYYASYMRWLCKLLADLRWSIYCDTEDVEHDVKGDDNSTERAQKMAKVYIETIPSKDDSMAVVSGNSDDNEAAATGGDDMDIVIVEESNHHNNSGGGVQSTPEREEDKPLPEKRQKRESESIEVVVDGGNPKLYPLGTKLETLAEEHIGVENARAYALVIEDSLNQPPMKYTLGDVARALGCQTLRLRRVDSRQLIGLYVYPIDRIEERRNGGYPIVYSSLVNRNSMMRDVFGFVKKMVPELAGIEAWYMLGYIADHSTPDPRYELSNSNTNAIANFYRLSHLEVVAFHK